MTLQFHHLLKTIFVLALWCVSYSEAFSVSPTATTLSVCTASTAESSEWDVSEAPPPPKSNPNLDGMELAWRHVKKPLVRIGSKGTTLAHGNSLRQLLEAHTVVKVKVNLGKWISLEEIFEQLRDWAVQSGASPQMELLQARASDKVMLIGLPGTFEKIQNGAFPPAPVARP